jgi:hypothetical protein
MLKKIYKYIKFLKSLEGRIDRMQLTMARIERGIQSMGPGRTFNEHEFSVFSQWGEDGLIQFLIQEMPIRYKTFIEFGVEDYKEANTRFLMMNNNWSGLIFDSSNANVQAIREDPIYWRHSLSAVPAFITRENINQLISSAGFSGDIGLLSIDVDGNDYWIWEAIHTIRPQIVICEYNSLWGAELSISTPYDAQFNRTQKHYSNLFFGASITALNDLALTKGYVLVGGNIAGNNAFFVREDSLGDLKRCSPCEAWAMAKFRESRDTNGNLSFLNPEDQLKMVSDQLVVNLKDGREYKIFDLFEMAV